jgi:hypothetical protein
MTQVAILPSANIDVQENEVVVVLNLSVELDVVYEQGVQESLSHILDRSQICYQCNRTSSKDFSPSEGLLVEVFPEDIDNHRRQQ